MLKQNIIRTLLFVIFLSVGAAALGASILVDDLLQYYHNRQLLEAAQKNLQRLEALNNDYDALLQRLKTDAGVVKNIAPAVVGSEPADANAIYPRATAEQLAAARQVLSEDLDRQDTQPTIPEWLKRCNHPVRRTVLFLAGACLILISFVSFSPIKEKAGSTEILP
jgi:cell division protein FtsL